MDSTNLPVGINTLPLLRPNLEVYYPEVYGLNNLAVQRRINNIIFRQVYMLIAEQGYFQNPQTQITGFYEIKTNEKGILSLAINNYAFAGGAHGLTIIKSLTFDILTGQLYQLTDLFKENSDYVKRLSDIVGEQIIRRQVPLIEEYKGIKPNQDYYIADKSLVIYFQLYELTPYVYGFPMFPISVYDIQDIINEQGPLGKMAVNQ